MVLKKAGREIETSDGVGKTKKTRRVVTAAELPIQRADSNRYPKLSRAEIDALVLDHQEHGRRLAWSFLSSWRVRLDQDEVQSAVGASLCEAAHRFDPTRGTSFKTFFFYHLRGMLLREVARTIQEQRVLQYMPHTMAGGNFSSEPIAKSTYGLPAVDNNNPEKLLEKQQVRSTCWTACANLDALEREVIIRYFINDESLIDISKALNYCRCHISRVKSRALKKLESSLSAFFKETSVTNKNDSPPSPRTTTGRKKPRVYTGGRGRRRQENIANKVETIALALKRAG